MEFDRQPDPDNVRLTTSVCKECGKSVGSSADTVILDILEDAHECSQQSSKAS